MRIAIIGNSGSGKSSLARALVAGTGAPSLDLDCVAWEPDATAVRRPAAIAIADVRSFCAASGTWVAEGCYASLVGAALEFMPQLVFLNPGEQQCLENCRSRPWEAHKYSSPAEQNKRLAFLLSWVSEYYTRGGEMSLAGHAELFETYTGPRAELTSLPSLDPPAPELMQWISLS